MGQIKKRNIFACILLTIITSGIYGIYWMYLLVQNTRTIQNKTTNCIGEMLCLLFVPFYALYWWYTRGEKVKQEFGKLNNTSKGNGIMYLILAFFGLGIVAMAIMQSGFNSLKTEKKCEKCGKELPEKYRHKLCEYCRIEKADRNKKVGLWAIGTIGAIISTIISIFIPKRR